MLLFTKFMIIKFSGMVDRRNINFHPSELSLGLRPRENSLGWKFMFLRSTIPENFIFLNGWHCIIDFFIYKRSKPKLFTQALTYHHIIIRIFEKGQCGILTFNNLDKWRNYMSYCLNAQRRQNLSPFINSDAHYALF